MIDSVNASPRAQSNHFTDQLTTNLHGTRPGEPSRDVRRRPLMSSAHIEAPCLWTRSLSTNIQRRSLAATPTWGYIWGYGAIPQTRYPSGASQRNCGQSDAGMRTWTRPIRLPVWGFASTIARFSVFELASLARVGDERRRFVLSSGCLLGSSRHSTTAVVPAAPGRCV